MRTGAGPVAGWGGSGGAAVIDGWEAYDATTLTPKAPYQDARVRNLTVTGTAVITSTTTSTGQFLGANGTKTAPSYSFTNDVDSGIYSVGANQVGMSAGDTLVQTWGVASTTMAFTVLGATGTKTAPSFAFSADPDSGLYSAGANNPAISAGDTKIMDWSTTLVTSAMPVILPVGAVGAPSIGFTGFANTGIYHEGSVAGAINFTSAGTYAGAIYSTCWQIATATLLGWGSTNITNLDTQMGRSAAGVLALYGSSTSNGSSLALASNKFVTWSSTTDPDGSLAVSMWKNSAYTSSVAVLNAAQDGIGFLTAGVVVSAKPSNYTIQNAADDRSVITNEGASGESTITLLTAVAGKDLSFYVQTAQSLKIVAATGDTIRVAAGVSTTAGYVRCATAGAVLRLTAINATEWVAMYQTGTWTVDA